MDDRRLRARSRGGLATAAVWTSEDAVEWERSSVDPHRRGAGESMAAAVPTDDGLLAVGRVGDGDESDGAVWRQDGDEWVQARPEAMAGEHEQWAFDVAAGAGGIVVAGGESAWGEVRARLWFSADGETWETVDGGPGGPLDATGEESVRDVASFGEGFVAVGSSGSTTSRTGPCGTRPTAGRGSRSIRPVSPGPAARRSAPSSTSAPASWPAATPTATAAWAWRCRGRRRTPGPGPAAPATRSRCTRAAARARTT